MLDVVVIGAGQAGLSAAYHLVRMGFAPYDEVVVLDRNAAPGGAWQHRWDSLTMHDVHGIANLPGTSVPESADSERANVFVPSYFAEYEKRFELPVLRPVAVESVQRIDGGFEVRTDGTTYQTAAIVNATGTWDRPFIPWYPGIETFAGRQLHTADYRGAAELAGQEVLVVGGGASAVQLLAEISAVASTTWVTRRPPEWHHDEEFTPELGRKIIAKVEERVSAGLPPRSVVSVTGLRLRPQEQPAWDRGVYTRHPMFARLTPDGPTWSDGRHQHIDTILWATGFRADLAHLTPLHLREPSGGIRMTSTATTLDPRIHLIGYGPSASTIGANRAGFTAARTLRTLLKPRTGVVSGG
ncbi:NAD(P)/FAD-dependent oxidoreductase [Kribbella sandramycini]|uniref:Cation diffusion facilitator CzcD-associated flavoprotein CzcO n=1 Tax=Kribbella sandramycini TaxID=60450 RepID=A0A7Y4L5X4_9ACTN|nr:FAD-dependent oxidoreductase [Kribbella sandramycini]MBB6570906.1 cation diffusion facilitator CzcD-associated flavoprotein CzcO [Kribbella sandramycini]NOL44037.1 NAD(P)/FAD-dependent oxidoreductase [Kribbella sandramycini]